MLLGKHDPETQWAMEQMIFTNLIVPISGFKPGARRPHYRAKTGCWTCRIRHLKCDEAKPSCQKCCKKGLVCPGYASTSKPKDEALSRKNSRDSSPSRKDLGSGISGNPIPVPGSPEHTKRLNIRRIRTLQKLCEVINARFWIAVLIPFSKSETTVWHSTLAVAFLQESWKPMQQEGNLRFPAAFRQASLTHYNIAIRLLAGIDSANRLTTEVILANCFQFVTIEMLLLNVNGSIEHLRGGLQIVRNWRTHGKFKSSIIEDYLAPQLYTSFFTSVFYSCLYGQIIPLSLEDAIDFYLPPYVEFLSMVNASIELFQILCYGLKSARSLREHEVDHGSMVPDSVSQKQYHDDRLHQWLEKFDIFYEKETAAGMSPGQFQEAALLRLTHRLSLICILLKFERDEAKYDEHIQLFDEILDQISKIYSNTSRIFSNDRTTYNFRELVFSQYYMIAIKCRDPKTRRKALGLLKSVSSHGMWDNELMIRVVERVIDMEEEALRCPEVPSGPVLTSAWSVIHDINALPDDGTPGKLFEFRQRINGEWRARVERIAHI